jgi:hypothetical protein
MTPRARERTSVEDEVQRASEWRRFAERSLARRRRLLRCNLHKRVNVITVSAELGCVAGVTTTKEQASHPVCAEQTARETHSSSPTLQADLKAISPPSLSIAKFGTHALLYSPLVLRCCNKRAFSC